MQGHPLLEHLRHDGRRLLNVDCRFARSTQAYTSRSSGATSATSARFREERNWSASMGGARAIIVGRESREMEDEESRKARSGGPGYRVASVKISAQRGAPGFEQCGNLELYASRSRSVHMSSWHVKV